MIHTAPWGRNNVSVSQQVTLVEYRHAVKHGNSAPWLFQALR